jgi:copper homeostasis protein CutC
VTALYASVLQGLTVLKELKALAGGRIRIMPGGGVSSSTAGTVIRELGAQEIHSSAKK